MTPWNWTCKSSQEKSGRFFCPPHLYVWECFALCCSDQPGEGCSRTFLVQTWPKKKTLQKRELIGQSCGPAPGIEDTCFHFVCLCGVCVNAGETQKCSYVPCCPSCFKENKLKFTLLWTGHCHTCLHHICTQWCHCSIGSCLQVHTCFFFCVCVSVFSVAQNRDGRRVSLCC